MYPEFNKLNHDHQLHDEFGVYNKNIGIDNCILSFGHDEYLYQVLKFNNCKIPQRGLDMIRYHSLYVWHTYGEYRHLMNESDYDKLKNVQLFNKYDLYTKENKVSSPDLEYYRKLIEKYITLDQLVW